ncbi:plasmid pRiA4b ORF-3 family protein [Geobacillus proteiniphilus]|uniref:Plasmid pRiA4b ORF-3 family protein n=1 Tax=Geobacillus proteiniphilus TaxID=860353 RepID=A0ABY9MK17_9BACL|nr:plasmid pRiA4b ORF-3 family protein [Geobacillus proteiniphilus]WMJ17544.1 plasmid pRiA4b ORF-3 family protein [Geobacillus proteiniphilus]
MIYQLKVQLKHTRPPVWRRLLVPGEMTFAELHRVLQAAFGWMDQHLHTFYMTKVGGTARLRIEIGNEAAGWDGADYDEREETIGQWFVEEGDRAQYVYDFGDMWEHDIVLEKIVDPIPDALYPCCIKAVRAGLEEDSWGEVRGVDEEISPAKLTARVNAALAPFQRKAVGEKGEAKETKRVASKGRTEEVERDVWKTLFDRALAYRDLAPWTWMDDDHIFAVAAPDGESLYCTVIGALGQEYGLVIYIGEEGYMCLQDILSGTLHPKDAVFQERALLVSLAPRNHLERDDKALLRKHHIPVSGKQLLPMFRSFVPGYYPWFLSEEEAAWAAMALEQAVVVAERLRGGELALAAFSRGNRLFARVAERREDGLHWRDGWVPRPKAKKKETSALDIGTDELAKAKTLERAPLFVEFSVAYVNRPIQERRSERPYFPLLALAADAASGVILHHQVFRGQTDAKTLQQSFLAFARALGCVPSHVRVTKEHGPLLAPLLRELGVNMSTGPTPRSDEVRQLFEQFAI